MKNLINTLLLSLRQSVKTPTNTLLCLFVLAGGIAIVTSMFRVCQIVLFSNAPYDRSERTAQICRTGANNYYDVAWSIDSYRAFVKDQTVFSDTLVFFGRQVAVENAGRDQRILACFVGTNVAEFTGIKPVMGRSFQEKDSLAGSERVVVISERLWETLYHSNPQIVGKTMVLNSTVRTIVGVMPEIFDGPAPMSGIRIWIPINLDTLHAEIGWANYVSFLGKIRDDVTPEAALDRTIDLSKQVYAAYPDDNRTMTSARFRFINKDLFEEHTRNMFQALFVCAMLILFMACGIASGLMTARYSVRTQEFAIRTALGASRTQLVYQMILEFLTISVASTILGLLLDHWIATSFLTSYLTQFGLPVYLMHQPSWPLFAFATGVLIVVTLASTVFPAVRASQTDIASIMRESTRTGSSLHVTKLSNFLIVWQVASAGTILCGGALMGYVIHEFSAMNNFYDTSEYVCATISFSPKDHANDDVKLDRVIRIMNGFENYPEIEKYAMSNEFFSSGQTQKVWIEGRSYPDIESVPNASKRIVSPGYFHATNVPIMLGREFEKSDNANNQQVAIVTDAFARKFFGANDALGKRFKLGEKAAYLTVVGVVPDIFFSDDSPRHPVGFFVPYCVARWQDILIFAKAHGSTEDMGNIMTKIVRDVDDKVTVSDIMPVSEYRKLYGGGLYMNFLFTFFMAFAVGALLMSAAGLYGIISFSVNSKRKDTGIRLALGASPESVVMMIARSGVINTAIGLFFATLGTLVMQRLVISDFSLVVLPRSGYWAAYAISAAILLSITTAAILIPAIRGASTEPSKALRDE
jgi:putative ABC transport system permease protein